MSTTYELRVGGHLEDHWSTALGALDLSHQPDGTATLTVQVLDQAQLHGVLAMLRDIGAPLLSLQILPATRRRADASRPGERAQRHTAEMSHAHGHRHGHGQAHDHSHDHSGGVMTRSRGYDLVGTVLFGGRRRRAYRELVLRSGARPGDRVLDVGSGTGYLTALLAEAVGPNGEAVGVDPSEAMVSQASEVRSGPGARYLVGFAESLALEDDSFDVVTSSLALHHIDENQRQAAAAEMARVLRPGGRVLVADFRPPNGRVGQWFVKNVVGLGMASNPVDVIPPLLVGAGFTDLSSGDVKPWLHWVSGAKPS